ncbi:MAG: hypothetical protein IT388_06500 [Nitrospirales bacterium]|nr:hypothetical protein [Nitrospirales bacterium]
MILLREENIPDERETLLTKPVGVLKATGMGFMKTGADIGAAATLALGGLQGALGNKTGQEKSYTFYEEVIKPAQEFWTPDPGSTSGAGKLFGDIAGLAIPVMTGPGAVPLLLGQSALNTGADMVEQGIDPTTATAAGIGAAAVQAAQVALPGAGKTLARTLGLAALNPLFGAGQTEATKRLLEARGYGDQAKAYDPLDPVARTLDLVLGVVFGGMAHYQRGRSRMPARVEDALDTIAAHQKAVQDSPFTPTPRAIQVNLKAKEKALQDMAAGKPVDVAEQVRDIKAELPESFLLPELRQGLKEHFRLDDEQTSAVVGLVEARARREAVPVDDYISKRIAGIVSGDAPTKALFQRERVKTQLSELFDYTTEGKDNSVRKVEIAAVALPESEIIKQSTGYDVAGYRHVIDNYSINHILKKHGDETKEATRGQLAVTRDDIFRIPEIIAVPDKVENGGKSNQGNDLILYIKKFNGVTYYFEEVRTGKGELAALSMRKYRAANDMPPERETPSDTSKTLRPTTDILPSAPKGINTLEQANRGAVQFLEDGRAVIHAFKQADVSTVVHELGHIFRRDLPGEDLAAAERWAGVEGGLWKREQEEQFAKAFERYLAEGKAPLPELQSVFQKFKQWILDIYGRIIGEDIWRVRMSPEVRTVFDRLFVGETIPLRTAEPPEAVKAKAAASGEILEVEQEVQRTIEQALPEEITITEDWGDAPTFTPKKRITLPLPKKELDRTHLEFIRDRLLTSEGPGKVFDEETGQVVARLSSGYPAWYQNKGYKQKEVVGIVDKYLSGKELTERQRAIMDLLQLAGAYGITIGGVQ